MSKVQMPEPAVKLPVSRDKYLMLFSPEQMDAYAAAKVREAMEDAAAAIEAANDKAGDAAAYDNRDMYPDEEARMQALNDAAALVRALIPQQ